uniref:Solute carrier family 46 member 3 n=1 Tax=Gadus morhua TaxID=8049 RepID=A0A8C4YZN5_GADMO
MGGSYLIQPVVAFYSFGLFMTIPLLQQYVYSRLWEQLSSAPYSSSQSAQCVNSSSNLTFTIMEVQKQASVFILYAELSFLVPSMFSCPLLVSCSDSLGRKAAIVPPLLGNLLFSVCCFLISCFSLDLHFLLGAGFVAGLFGGPSALLGGCFAYVADRCREEARAGVDLIWGLIAGLAPACTGVLIYAIGFRWPFLIVFLLYLLTLAYVVLVLGDSLASVIPLPSQKLLGQLQSVYMMFGTGSRRRNTALGLTLAVFALFKMCRDGGMSIIILYQLNQPLCWSELLIGCSSLLGMIVHLGSYAGVSFFSRCLDDANVVLLGLLSLAGGLLMAAFAHTTLLMLLVRLPLILSDMPSAVLRSMMSNLVPGSEQGAVFACVVFLEMLSACVALVVFNSTYAATVTWFSGFSFLLASLLTVIPALLIG